MKYILLLLLLMPFIYAQNMTYVEHTLSDGQTITFHDFAFYCNYTPNCNYTQWEIEFNLYIQEMEKFIQSQTIIEADIISSNTVVSHNYLYASAGTFVSDYPLAVQHLLNIRTLPNGEIDKDSYPDYLTTSVLGTPVLNSGKTNDFLLHLLANSYRQQQTIMQDTCGLPQARERLSWCV